MSLENTVGKGEIAHNEQFLLFPQCFLPIWRTFCHFHQIQNCHLQTLSVWKSLKFVIWERVNSKSNDNTCISDLSKFKAFSNKLKCCTNYEICVWKGSKHAVNILLVTSTFYFSQGVPRGSVLKCLTRNPGVLGSSCTGSSGVFFRGSVLGQDTSEHSLVLVKPRKDMNNVNCHRDMTEILLKVA